MLQPRKASQISRPRADQNAEKPHASDLFQQHVEIEGGAAPQIVAVHFEKDLRGSSSFVAQTCEEIPFRIELRGGAEFGHDVVRDAMDAHARP